MAVMKKPLAKTGEDWRSVLTVKPCKQADAKRYIQQNHRHHRPPVGAIFCLCVVDDKDIVRGVLTAGRPVARNLDDGETIEVNRVATDGCANACSALLGAARRVAFAMGYRSIITYTLPDEGGASLRGAGWTNEATTTGDRGWSTPKYQHINRRDDHPLQAKHRWVSVNKKARTGRAIWPQNEQEDDRQLTFVIGANK